MIAEIEPKAFHTGQMARTLRTEHKGLLSDAKIPTHRELRDAFDGSIITRAWTLDGKLCAIAGVTGTQASHEGNIWLAVTDAATKHPNAFARRALRFIKDVTATRRVTTFILANDRAGKDLAYFLGFTVDKRSQVKGVDVIAMSYTPPARKAA